MLNTSHLLITLILLCIPGIANSGIINLGMGQGLVASAEFMQGDSTAPGVLILHGFLQTRDFITVRRLADSLHESGYSVLLPNLTLGINVRRESLSCEAIHTHSMQQDLTEIARWIDWLAHRTRHKIVLIGHSAGSLQLVAYLSSRLDPPIQRAIFISLISFGLGPVANETPEDKQRAYLDRQTAPGSLRDYALAYCKRYPTTPEHYLSYVYWDRGTTLQALSRIQSPITVILGGEDQRISPDWAENLKKLDMIISSGKSSMEMLGQAAIHAAVPGEPSEKALNELESTGISNPSTGFIRYQKLCPNKYAWS